MFRWADHILTGKDHVPEVFPNTTRNVVAELGPQDPVAIEDEARLGDSEDTFAGYGKLGTAGLSKNVWDGVVWEDLSPGSR